jgi:hypothetical protein
MAYPRAQSGRRQWERTGPSRWRETTNLQPGYSANPQVYPNQPQGYVNPQGYASQAPNQSTVAPQKPYSDSTHKNLDSKLLQVLNEGVNEIILNIKRALGNNTQKVNARSLAIIKVLDDLSYMIYNEQGTLDKSSIDSDASNFKDFKKSIHDANVQNPGKFIENLPANLQYRTERPIKLDTTDNITIVENRLKNCQNLEYLYLIKHDELLKTFDFTINLFDKYKYASKLILYLLRNLVEKDGQIQEIDLPLPIIENISKLITDQDTIQSVINRMKPVVENKIISVDDKALPNEGNINTGEAV